MYVAMIRFGRKHRCHATSDGLARETLASILKRRSRGLALRRISKVGRLLAGDTMASTLPIASRFDRPIDLQKRR